MSPVVFICILFSSSSGATSSSSPTYRSRYAFQQSAPQSSALVPNSPMPYMNYYKNTPSPYLKTSHTVNNKAKATVPAHPSKLEKRQEEAIAPAALPVRIPGIPRNPPWPVTVNVSNVLKLFQSVANDEEINDDTEELLVQTLREVGSFIGLQDTRDLFGIFLMYFILGPILIPLYWLPISLLALGFLMIPLVYKSPPVAAGRSNNNNVLGRPSAFEESSNCIEMVACEVTNTLRSSSWSSWADEKFNLTQVEYIGGDNNRRFQIQEECSKYPCLMLKPIQGFFSSWYSYFFTYENFLKPAADAQSTNSSKSSKKHKYKQLRSINLQ